MRRALLAFIVVYMLCDQGVANLLGLETLRHGTCWRNWVLIHISGVDPAEGGKSPGEFHLDRNANCHGAFFVYDDESILTKRVGPKKYAAKSTSAWLGHTWRYIGWLTPAIKLHFDPSEVSEKFHRDDLIDGALYTTERVGIDHLGISGSVIQAVKYPNPSRMIGYKPFLGITQLTTALLFVLLRRPKGIILLLVLLSAL